VAHRSGNTAKAGRQSLRNQQIDGTCIPFSAVEDVGGDKEFDVIAMQGSSLSRSGEVLTTDFFDDFYMVQVDADLNTGSAADIWVRYKDINNGYRVRLTSRRRADKRRWSGQGHLYSGDGRG
jgi:hypothetical protein